MQSELPSFAELRSAYVTDEDEEPPSFTSTFTLEPNMGPEEASARLIIDYLLTLGVKVRSLDQLYDAISRLDDEELAAFRTREGVAVSVASDGLLVLFVDGDPT